MTKSQVLFVALIAAVSTTSRVEAFAPPATTSLATTSSAVQGPLFAADDDSAFVADVEPEEDKTFDAVEKFGKGAAKTKRGKRKGIDPAVASAATARKAAATLAPEETFYEGPPAITETIAPTISILTVVGIVPAAASWARQVWVRYNITSRRIRVTSGVGGKDMAEIVYPDVVEIKTVKRLFGDGDVVFSLRDGAKFEMRNVPNFDEALEFILKQCDKDVVAEYKSRQTQV